MTEPTTSRTPSRWSGLSTEDRRSERRTLLLESTFDLLATQGSASTTVRAVCARARLNPRYFYESFDDLDALVVAVYERVVTDLRARIATEVVAAGEQTGDAIRAAVRATVGFVHEDRRRGRVLYVEAMGNEALNVRRLRTGFDLVDLVHRDAARRGASTGSEQVDRVSAAMLVGRFSEILASWLDGRIDMSPDELIASSTALFVAVGEAAAAHAVR